ncbi:MAG TPA: hypothetical protein VER96_11850 [Polyangiaceae bacterium]|nr:hypothetical protein [Polyangiaceae bacterium]
MAEGLERAGRGNTVAPDLDALTLRVNEICRSATFDLAFRIGELIIKELFANDTDLWEKERTHARSYRALASRGDLALSPSALCRAVGVYSLVEQMGGRERWHHLGASHFQEVLSLGLEARRDLLTLAEEQQWPVSRLRIEAARYHRRGRAHSAANRQARSIRLLASRVNKYRQDLSTDEPVEMSAESARSVQDAVRQLAREVEELETWLKGQRAEAAPHESDIQELIRDRSKAKRAPGAK